MSGPNNHKKMKLSKKNKSSTEKFIGGEKIGVGKMPKHETTQPENPSSQRRNYQFKIK
jgi:hypothetical protein